MPQLPNAILAELNAIVGADNVTTEPNLLRHNSRDSYWYSPVLKPLLDDKEADVIVHPATRQELLAVIALAARARVPLTMRGAGTGNYGQGVPMQGGILINTKRMDRILEITPESARVEAGTLLINIERAANEIGAELRFFPSTIMTATAGGFLAGGSGGVGSITWGTLWDEGNVLAVTIATMTEEPQLLTVTTPEEMRGVVHNCGLTCIITDLTFALAPAQPWQQHVAAFPTFDAALRFGESLAYDPGVTKRLITALEWPIPSFFRQLVRDGACPNDQAIVLLHLTMDKAELAPRVAHFGGALTWHSPHENYYRKGWQLSDFSWNHTTLWAMKADPQLTYLQDALDPQRVHEQLRLRKQRFGDDVLEHVEFMKMRGRIGPQGLSVVRFHTKEQLWALMAWCEENGIRVANPHTHRLDEDMRWNGQPILDAKDRWDPHGLLNPGHLAALEESRGVEE